jgi:transcriptional regulator with XRE-family HTH domain
MTIGKKVKELLKEDFRPSKKRVKLSTGEVLKIIREKNEFSQNKLAELTELTQATISSLENNRINLGIERAKVLARALNVHPATLAFPDWDESDFAA